MATPEQAMATMIANLAAKTGKTLDQWIALAKKSKLEKHGELVQWLKQEHELTHGYANLIAHKTLATDAASQGSDEDLVAAQYSGAKAALRPIYEAILAAVQRLGTDIEVAPKKAYVSLRRNKQFAIVQPSTSTRVDLGLNLKGVAPTGKLEAAGSFNSMVSHRVRLESKADVDAAVLGWLAQAYQAS